MHEDFNERAATWDDDPSRVARAQAVADAIRRSGVIVGHPKTADLGAGTGLLARSLADALGPTTLVDAAEAMVEVGREALSAAGFDDWTALPADLNHEPVPGGPYDLVISLLALHHIDDVPAMLHRLRDSLTADGRIAFADLDRDVDGAYHAHAHDFHGYHGFDRDELAGWLTDAGFTDVAFSLATTLRKGVDGAERDFPLFLVTARRNG